MKYRAIVEVDAIQFTGENLQEAEDFTEGEFNRTCNYTNIIQYGREVRVNKGDYLVRSNEGNLFKLTRGEFESNYKVKTGFPKLTNSEELKEFLKKAIIYNGDDDSGFEFDSFQIDENGVMDLAITPEVEEY